MRMRINHRPIDVTCSLCAQLLVALACQLSVAQNIAYTDSGLTSVFPAGAQRETTVQVMLQGPGVQAGESRLVIDGPPGIVVDKVEPVQNEQIKATLTIAADAPLGRRTVRVHNLNKGLTSSRYFFVSGLPETVEDNAANNTAAAPQTVQTPVIVNGKINSALDVDFYRFEARAGQSLVAAILAHGMDSFLNRGQGFLDTSLELLDAEGKTVASDEDSVGLDPLIHVVIPHDGQYTLAVKSLGLRGSDYAVYRLTLGEVPYPTAVFPAGGLRGTEVEVELSGPNIPPGTRERCKLTAAGSIPVEAVTPVAGGVVGCSLPLARGDFPEVLEIEPNDESAQAVTLSLPVTVNGRFLTANDPVDSYRMKLAAGQKVLLQTLSQRHLNAPVDTELEVLDATGKLLASNDDGVAFGGAVQCAHDFVSSDSWLNFVAPAEGEYLVRVRNVNGTFGPRTVYRLSVQEFEPDFLIYQWPAEVPIWGPGTSATFVVEIMKWGGLEGDIQVSVEGLPAGWQAGVAHWPAKYYWAWNAANGCVKLIVSITAPADAAIGTVVPFRVIARTEQAGKQIEHEAHYLTLYGGAHNDRMHLRATESPRVAVAAPIDTSITTEIRDLVGVPGQTIEIPVDIKYNVEQPGTIGLVINGPTPSAGCGWGAPAVLSGSPTKYVLPLSLAGVEPGIYGIVVARSWASDLRSGRPGPCTQMIRLQVKAPDAK